MEEITAEYAAAELVERPPLRVRLGLSVASKTDLGRVREHNEDRYEFFIPEDTGDLAIRGAVFLVCDGMGGHSAGQIASELAAKTFIDVYMHHPSLDPAEAARAAVVAANRFVLDVSRAVPGRGGMGTTLSALMLVQGSALIAQVGDSRVYRLRGDEFAQITLDHTWVEEAIRRGQLPPEAAHDHPYRHVLTRAIGTEVTVEPDIFDLTLEAGDVFLLCSDGLINHVSDASLAQTLRDNGLSAAVWKLVNAALADGGSDNTTVVAVRVDSLDRVD